MELRQAVRSLVRTPLVTTAAVVSLALAIGANAAMFSLLNGLALRDLPVRDPERLVIIGGTPPGPKALSYPVWREIHARRDLFAATAAWAPTRFDLAAGGESDFADGMWVSGGYFDLLGVRPFIGRLLTDADDQRGGGATGPVAVVSYSFWQRRFNGAADVIGRTLTVEQVPFTVVGVMPPAFFGTDVGRRADVAVPFGAEPLMRRRDTALDEPRRVWLGVLARLKPGQSVEAAAAAVRGVQPQIREATMPAGGPPAMAATYLREPLVVTSAATGASFVRALYVRPLAVVMGIAAIVLLIASANVANLLLARTAARRHELAVRLALGASRWQLIRPMLLESGILAVAGASAGLIVAQSASRLLLVALSTDSQPMFLDVSPDWRVLAFTAAATSAALLISGLLPAIHGTAQVPVEALKDQDRVVVGERRPVLPRTLVSAQVALSVVLVAGAALLVRSFVLLVSHDAGFERDRLLIVTMNAQRAAVPISSRLDVYERARDAVRAVPGVQHAAVSLVTPVSGLTVQNVIDEVSGSTAVLSRERRMAMVNFVSEEFLDTFGTRLLAGRGVKRSDRAESPKVAVVNETFARTFLGGSNPIGRTIKLGIFGPEPEVAQIVGVAVDSAYASLREPPQPTVYLALAQHGQVPFLVSVSLSVRSIGAEPAVLSRSVAAAIASVNPQLALTIRPFSAQLRASVNQDRLVAWLAGLFGAVTLLMAGIGLYGVTGYAVARRRTEIGIRMALGAAPGTIVRMVLSDVGTTVGIGVAAGVLAGTYLARFVAPLLYGTTPRDPLVFASAAATLAAVGLLAGWWPARRASRVDPAEVLREA